MRIVIFFVFFVISLVSQAEIYKGIGPFSSLGDVKAIFPHAEIGKLDAAWVQPGEALYEISGGGITGTIVIKFDDGRPNFRKLAADETDSKMADFYKSLANDPDDKALTVSWVRWVPDTAIPLQRLLSKYGKPSESGFNDEYRPYRKWESKGVHVILSENEKYVFRIDHYFTKDEIKQYWRDKHGFVPKYLD